MTTASAAAVAECFLQIINGVYFIVAAFRDRTKDQQQNRENPAISRPQGTMIQGRDSSSPLMFFSVRVILLRYGLLIDRLRDDRGDRRHRGLDGGIRVDGSARAFSFSRIGERTTK
jgi:hypothetical protein